MKQIISRTLSQHFQLKKSPATSYFRVFNEINPHSYLILACFMEYIPSHISCKDFNEINSQSKLPFIFSIQQIHSPILFWPFEWIILPVVPYFRILDCINPQLNHISASSMKYIFSCTLFQQFH